MIDQELQLLLDKKQDEILTGMPVPQDGKIGDIRTNVTHKGKFYQMMKVGIDSWRYSAPFSQVPSIHTRDDYLLKSGGKMLNGSLLDVYDMTVRKGLTLPGLSPGDAVLVLDGTGKVVTDDNLTWDGSELSVTGAQDIMHTATEADDHALEIDCNAAGFGDVKAIDIDYITGAIATGQGEGIILVNIDESLATGGDVFALEVLATEGAAGTTAEIYGLKAAALVGPIHQDSGTFADMDSALVNAVDRRAEFISAGSDIAIFVADNDTVTIGDAATFEEIEFLLATTASVNIKPTFEFSTGVGAWTAFTPVDGTNGMRNTGVIAWDVADIPTWAVGAGAEYLIRITRTKNNLSTVPVEDKVQIAATTTYEWDKSGDLSIRDIAARAGTFSTTLGVTGAATFSSTIAAASIGADTDNSVIILNGAGLLKTDEIDPRVWGASLVDYTGTPANNQVATFTDVDTIQGESGLTYDGSKLHVVGTENGISTIIYAPLADAGSGSMGQYQDFVFEGLASGAGSRALIRHHANYFNDYNSALSFWTQLQGVALAERMRIDNAGNVGINITGPLAKLHIDQASTTAAIPVLTLDQADVSDGFINFIGSDRGVITGATDSLESVRVEIGGVVRRIALYVDA